MLAGEAVALELGGELRAFIEGQLERSEVRLEENVGRDDLGLELGVLALESGILMAAHIEPGPAVEAVLRTLSSRGPDCCREHRARWWSTRAGQCSPTTGQLWCSTNERDALGNNLVPDYITHVQEHGFYGWPWFYMGGHQDPRLEGKHPELKSQVITPDILLEPTSLRSS